MTDSALTSAFPNGVPYLKTIAITLFVSAQIKVLKIARGFFNVLALRQLESPRVGATFAMVIAALAINT